MSPHALVVAVMPEEARAACGHPPGLTKSIGEVAAAALYQPARVDARARVLGAWLGHVVGTVT